VDNRILKIPSTGGTNTVFAAATNIWGLAFDASGALFVADNNTNVIWKYATNGSRTSFSTDHVVAPGFLAFDTDGRLYSANYFTNTLYRYATNGTATLIGTNNLTTPEGVSVWPLPSWLIPGTAVATPTLAAPSYAGGQFSFTVSGTTGANYVVQATTNLTTWFTVTTNTAPFTYTETNAAIYLQRFYRAATP
jgi:sugar lactone lactonase YvrE